VFSRSNSIFGHDDKGVKQEHDQESEKDSDYIRKKLSKDIREDFDRYSMPGKVPFHNWIADNKSEFASNHNVEFEDLTDGSKAKSEEAKHEEEPPKKRQKK